MTASLWVANDTPARDAPSITIIVEIDLPMLSPVAGGGQEAIPPEPLIPTKHVLVGFRALKWDVNNSDHPVSDPSPPKTKLYRAQITYHLDPWILGK